MVGWHYQLNGHEFEQTLGDGEGQGSLVCCSPSDHRELDTDAFELWCWRRLLMMPWTARRSNQSFLKEINPEYSCFVLVFWPQGVGDVSSPTRD